MVTTFWIDFTVSIWPYSKHWLEQIKYIWLKPYIKCKIFRSFSLENLLLPYHKRWFLLQLLPILISIIWRYNYLSSKRVKSVNSYLISPWSLDLKLLIFVDICNKQNQEEIILIERCRAETALLHKTDVYVNINRKVLKGF